MYYNALYRKIYSRSIELLFLEKPSMTMLIQYLVQNARVVKATGLRPQ